MAGKPQLVNGRYLAGQTSISKLPILEVLMGGVPMIRNIIIGGLHWSAPFFWKVP